MVGQSGTARPTFLLVTIPPLQMSNSVAAHVSHAKRLSHFVDLSTEEDMTNETDGTNAADAPLVLARKIYPPGLGDGDAAGSAGLLWGCSAPGDGEGAAPCAPPASSARSFSHAW